MANNTPEHVLKLARRRLAERRDEEQQQHDQNQHDQIERDRSWRALFLGIVGVLVLV